VGGEPSTIGILADKVHDVAAMEGMSIEDAPTVGMRWRADFIRGITRRNGQFVILPDLDLILADSLAQAAKVSAAA
jgi:purine-binding chemotaxis protein CheW